MKTSLIEYNFICYTSRPLIRKVKILVKVQKLSVTADRLRVSALAVLDPWVSRRAVEVGGRSREGAGPLSKGPSTKQKCLKRLGASPFDCHSTLG